MDAFLHIICSILLTLHISSFSESMFLFIVKPSLLFFIIYKEFKMIAVSSRKGTPRWIPFSVRTSGRAKIADF